MFEQLIPKALDLLKASGWQSAAIAIAAAVFLLLSKVGTIPPLDPTWTLVTWAVLLLAGMLAIASLGPLLSRGLTLLAGAVRKGTGDRRFEKKFRDYIPYMTEDERRILGYLLKHKQKMFLAESDGGNAGTLLAQGFVGIVARRGQQFDFDKIPFGVADQVWRVMETNPELFKYEPQYDRDDKSIEPEPWRIHWMTR